MSYLKSEINYVIGKEYPFTVVAIYDDFCELRDESNFPVYLQHTNNLMLVREQRIVCKVLDNSKKRPKIEMVVAETNDEKLEGNTVEAILKEFATSWNTRDFTRLLLMIEKDRSFEDGCRAWIASLVNTGCELEQVRIDCTKFLEQSRFLSLCTPAEREFYQERLTKLIELLGNYIKAHELLAEGGENDFVDSLFEKLRSSAYVYHPQKNFNIMSCLFLADRELMKAKMENLFDIIRMWKVEIWGREPFNSTLTKIIDLYVNENIWLVDRVKDNLAQADSMMQALTIQLLLMKAANKDMAPAYRLCLARLCLMASYLFQQSPKKALDLALYNLLNSSCMVPTFSLNETRGRTVPYRIAGMAPKPLHTNSCFLHGKGKLLVTTKGIALYATQEEWAKSMLPENMDMWSHLQVFADKRSVRGLSDKVGIIDSMHLWQDIEQDLFAAKEETVTQKASIGSHKLYEKVNIVITEQDKNDSRRFLCRIDDEMGGEGYIRLDDIVPYGVGVEIGHFRSETGKNLVFEATIIGKEDGAYRFSMLNVVKKWAETFFGENERVVCTMFADKPAKGIGIPAVSEEGFSVCLGGFDEIPEKDFKRGDTVVASFHSEGPGTFHIYCKVIEHYHGPQFYISSAFHRLMMNFAYEDADDTTLVEENLLQQSDKMMDADYVREIIRMVDRVSSTESDYVKSYNYLGFARILCLMIGWEEQASYYKGRMELILMLHDFALNDRVDQERLETLEKVNADIFKNDAILYSKFLQLQTIGYMGKNGHDNDLWETYSSHDGLVKDVASLVIAYNMVKRNNMANLCVDLQNRIKQTLRLKGYESNLKMYGTGVEDSRTEYKTSIVFPPNDDMRPDLDKQMKNIMKVIASFLNTYGGVLYVGVNDSGAGVGIEADLNYEYFFGDKDKYQRTITDSVFGEWGSMVATYVDVAFDHTNEQKDVLVVTVRPYPEGVAYNGKWLVRIGSSKREMSAVEYEKYKKGSRLSGLSREDLSLREDALFAASPALADAIQQPEEALLSAADVQTEEKQAEELPLKAIETIPTSRIRKNMLEDYEDDYRPHIACFKFLENGRFTKVTTYDYDPCLLNLAVYDEEARAYLVLGYGDGRVAKVPVKQLLKNDDYRVYARNMKSKLVFASIAQEEDALLTILRLPKGGSRLMARLDSLSLLEEETLLGTGGRFFKEGIAQVVGYDVVPKERMEGFDSFLDKDARLPGAPVATLPEGIRRKLAQWGVMD